MSGTSLDGADAALIDFSAAIPHTLAFATVPFSDRLREELLVLSKPAGGCLEGASRASMELADLYARAAEDVLARVDRSPGGAIGCHRDTGRHPRYLAFTITLDSPLR